MVFLKTIIQPVMHDCVVVSCCLYFCRACMLHTDYPGIFVPIWKLKFTADRSSFQPSQLTATAYSGCIRHHPRYHTDHWRWFLNETDETTIIHRTRLVIPTHLCPFLPFHTLLRKNIKKQSPSSVRNTVRYQSVW